MKYLNDNKKTFIAIKGSELPSPTNKSRFGPSVHFKDDKNMKKDATSDSADPFFVYKESSSKSKNRSKIDILMPSFPRCKTP